LGKCGRVRENGGAVGNVQMCNKRGVVRDNLWRRAEKCGE